MSSYMYRFSDFVRSSFLRVAINNCDIYMQMYCSTWLQVRNAWVQISVSTTRASLAPV